MSGLKCPVCRLTTTTEHDVEDAWDDALSVDPGVHTLSVTIDNGGPVRLSVKCEAQAEAPCRLSCDGGCELMPCDHMPRRVGDCNVVEFLTASGDVVDCYEGPDGEALVSGPIAYRWDGDCYLWTLA